MSNVKDSYVSVHLIVRWILISAIISLFLTAAIAVSKTPSQNISPIPIEFQSPEARKKAVKKVIRHYGGGELDEPAVLLIGDNETDETLSEVLVDEGFEVTFFENDYDYENDPAADEFDVIVLTDGTTYTDGMPTEGQEAILDFVENGGGLIFTEWVSYEVGNGNYQTLSDLIMIPRTSGSEGAETYTMEDDHQVTEGLPDTFEFTTGTNEGTATEGLVVVSGERCGDAVAVMEYEDGFVVQFASGGSYGEYDGFADENMQQLLINSINWAAGGAGEVDAVMEGFITSAETGDGVEDAIIRVAGERDTTDVNGYYQFEEMRSGIRLVRIIHDEYSDYEEEIEVEIGENTFDFEINPRSPVSGTILDVDTGDPIEDASVTFGEETTTSDENGEWEIPPLDQGEYAVIVLADHYYEYIDDVEVFTGENNFEWNMIPLATVSGTITDSETDLPVEGAEISFDSLYSAVSDENGEYSIIDVLAGEYDVEIEMEGYFDYVEDDVEVEERENVLDFEIDILSAPLSGIVRDELTEEFLFGATITVIDAVSGETINEVQTDEAGEYTTGTLHDNETFLAIATMNGYAPSDTAELLIRWNRDNVHDFELTPIFALGIRQLQQEQDLETWVTTTGIVTQGTNVTDTEETSIYIQDESGWGIMIWDDDPWDPENNINRGDGVTVIGFLVEIDEMTRITNFEIEVTSNDNALPDPLVETTGDMSGNEQREGTWGQISGQINRDPPGEGDFSLIVDDGSGQCEVRIVETTGIDMSAFSANDWGTFTGVIGLSRQGLRLIPNMQDDISRIAIDPPTDLTSEQELVPGAPLQLEVTLSWAHDHLDDWLRFKIYRDGEHIGNTQQNTWSEKLEDPDPGEFGSYTYEYEVTAVYDEGETEGAEIEVIWDITLVHERPYSGVPTEWALDAVYPNPFNPTLHIVLGVPEAAITRLEITDILGRRVEVLNSDALNPAWHRFSWNANGYPTGLYFLQVKSETGFNTTRKVMYLK